MVNFLVYLKWKISSASIWPKDKKWIMRKGIYKDESVVEQTAIDGSSNFKRLFKLTDICLFKKILVWNKQTYMKNINISNNTNVIDSDIYVF